MLKRREEKGEELRKSKTDGLKLIEVHYMQMNIKMKPFVH
jgi:hypothetical protein